MKALNDLIEVILNFNDREEVIDFLQGILTPAELEDIPTRLQIIRLLKKGVPQHQIAEQLRIGVATVTRGSKELKLGRFKYLPEGGDQDGINRRTKRIRKR